MKHQQNDLMHVLHRSVESAVDSGQMLLIRKERLLAVTQFVSDVPNPDICDLEIFVAFATEADIWPSTKTTKTVGML